MAVAAGVAFVASLLLPTVGERSVEEKERSEKIGKRMRKCDGISIIVGYFFRGGDGPSPDGRTTVRRFLYRFL